MVTCERALANGDYDAVDTDMCDALTRPTAVQHCRADTQCHQWQTGPWSRVSATTNLSHYFLGLQTVLRISHTRRLLAKRDYVTFG